jgi:diguanylate cyclase (GGDEF)-like protein
MSGKVPEPFAHTHIIDMMDRVTSKTSLTGLSVLLIGTEAACQILRPFIKEAASELGKGGIVEARSIADARGMLTEGSHYGAILFVPERLSPDIQDFVMEINHRAYGPLVVVTDNRDVVENLRGRGHPFFLSVNGLDTQKLIDAVFAAYEFHKLSSHNRTLKNQAHTAEQRFKDIADQFVEWLWEIDDKLNIVFSSTRKRPSHNARPGVNFADCFLPDERTRVVDDFTQMIANGRPFQDREYWSFDTYGGRLCWSLSGMPVLDNVGRVVGYRGMAKDVSVQKSSADQLYYLTNHDQLTGLLNRARFYDETERLLRMSGGKREGQQHALMAIDVDRFQYANETYGHGVGDKLLVHITQLLLDNVRAGDLIARTGGDEFAILMVDSGGKDVDYRATALLEAVKNRPMMTEKGAVSFGFSIGIVKMPEHATTLDQAVAHAGIALSQAKRKGRNRAETFTPSEFGMHDVTRRLEWLNFVAHCLNHEQERVVMHYQPIVSLDGDLTREFYEVLVRMLDLEGNLVPPVKFIQTAEEFGFAGKIDRIVTTRAIDMLAKWHEAGRKVSLSVNISGRTFDDKDFLSVITSKLDRTPLPAGALVFEITETAVIRDMTNVRHFISEMKKRGAHFALDDCGVGYSSFNYIKQLELDYIKIDGTFIRNLHRSDDDDAFVLALRDVARKMGIRTVAEMVEHEETNNKLKTMGIDFAQGFYYAVPAATVPDKKNIN